MKKPTKPQRRLKCPRGFTMKQAKFNRIFYHKFANVDDVIKRNYQNMDETDLRVLL
ncbi:hypothetical protein FACS1894166_02920 [Bacilli bacterium]|nr:hypothetical protein FACS1894166_02920 [Bacilli bacterium]